jgi:hypothetical protein
MTEYHCSACGTIVDSQGTNAVDHMKSAHGYDPENRKDDDPYLIPVDSNPTLDENGVPT